VGADPDDPTSVHEPVPDYLAGIDGGVRGLRVGVDRGLIARGTDSDTMRVIEEAMAVLARLGALPCEVGLPSLDQIVRDALSLSVVEAAVAHEATYPPRAAEYGPVLARALEDGRRLDGLTVTKMWLRRVAFHGRLNGLFRDIDLLIMPAVDRAGWTLAALAAAGRTPQVLEARLRFTSPFDMSGHPTLTLPGGKTGEGLPVGFQLVGRHMEEPLILRAGHAFQVATDWHWRRPPVD
jgi:amidase